MFVHLVDANGCVELDQVHRFRHDWERHASLRLRNGDPAVLTEYNRRGRLHDGSLNQMEQEVITAWRQARSRGETVALMANSTDTVTRLNRLAQHARISMGELDPDGPSLDAGDESMLIGDEVVTRRNDRRLRTDRGLMVKNRDHWTITDIHPDSDVTLCGRTGTIRIPGEYVVEDIELGYAQTSYATRGRTVDVAHPVGVRLRFGGTGPPDLLGRWRPPRHCVSARDRRGLWSRRRDSRAQSASREGLPAASLPVREVRCRIGGGV